PDPTVFNVSKAQANKASRFLNHATLGVNYATITQVATMGEAAWIAAQFNQPIGKHLPYSQCLLAAYMAYDNFEKADAVFGDPVEFRRFAWWTQVMTAPDLLRQRVAMSLSEIFVVSDNVGKLKDELEPLPGYYDMLLTNSFGNFRDLLYSVTMHPSMGVYLSHVNNAKANEQKGFFPDENYAREVMQLFSIGLFELNPDGSRKKDEQNQDMPTYNNETIREFAKVFTGLSYSGAEAEFGDQGDEGYSYFAAPMKMFEAHHDSSAKHLLNGVTLAAGQKGMDDINAAIDNLFNHANVGPFIGQLLIKRLVTSNPSPAYIARVSMAFNGDGETPRGDMKNLISAILTDPEAQSAQANKLREPFLRIVQLYRAFNATSSDRSFNNEGGEIQEHINQFALSSPSVFNFFQPHFAPNGELKAAGMVAPEFQIVNSSTVIGIKNYLHGALLGEMTLLTPETFAPVQFDLNYEIALAADPDKLIDHLDAVLTYGTLTTNSRQAIHTAITGVSQAKKRVLLGIYLMMVSPDYAAAL
ncbi:MAG: DUF1800 domain-containing protein, partial [Psychrosphaera sp.]|nr:DUF1800 domain-containing protein [Psychrosphaera sp.]